ncbi:ribonuclease H-like protein [Mycena maculata]|uniref:Ribonuclease H-like protein n=1 Tax=Mycena maculata TaxID=230809 RepID=A0AAD7I184_9AGAR|nr:ribonuclease H-like protein [Mycena maculata]
MKTDGTSCAGAGCWISTNDPKNRAIGVPSKLTSRTSGELVAILHVIQRTPQNTVLNFIVRSKALVHKLTVGLHQLESNGWIGEIDKTLLKTITAALRLQASRCTFRVTQDSNDAAGLEAAYDLAKKAMRNDPDEYITDPDDLYTDVPARYQLQGATFYAAIRATRKCPERKKTLIMLDKVRYSIESQCGKIPTDEDIWKSIRHKDIDRRIRNFLWKAIHQTFKCGDYWRNIPNYEQWAECPLWEMKHPKMPNLSMGLVLGCALTEFKNSRGKLSNEANRLFRIIISKSAFLIWKIRCERLMSRNSPHSETEIHNRWVATINKRLKIDRLLTDISRYGSHALHVNTVLKTWDGVLMDNKTLPDNWIWQSEVLVGIGNFRPPGRNR